MSAEVRRVGDADVEVWAEAVETFRHVHHDRHREFLADPTTIAFVAADGRGVVGWAWGHRLSRADGESMVLLYELEVVPPARRQGVGRALVEAFLELGRSEGHGKMWLITGADNTAARALYESTGAATSDQDDVGYWWALR